MIVTATPSTQDDEIKRELIQLASIRVLYAGQEPLVPLGKSPPYMDINDQEENSAGSVMCYLTDLLVLFEDYFETLDLVSSLNLGCLKLEAVKTLNPSIGEQVEARLEERRKSITAEGITQRFKDTVDQLPEEEGDDDGDIFEISDVIPMPDGTRPEHIRAITRDLMFINQCYYQSYIPDETEEDTTKEGSGTLAGFNAAYLWVKQALDDLNGMQPGQDYPIKIAPKLAASPTPVHGFTPLDVSCRMQ